MKFWMVEPGAQNCSMQGLQPHLCRDSDDVRLGAVDKGTYFSGKRRDLESTYTGQAKRTEKAQRRGKITCAVIEAKK